MAKVKINWPPMSMKAEGEDAAVLAQAEQFLKYVKEANKISFDVLPTIFRDGCRDPEELDDEVVEPLTEPEEVVPGTQWDVVAIYDNAGIPSIMHRFRRMNDKELFRSGKDKPHPAFIIGGVVYDEIYVSVYAMDGIKFTNEKPQHGRANFESWEDVRMECWSDQLMELGLFAGEKKAYCSVDATEGEYLPLRGGDAGLFSLYLDNPRSNSHWPFGGRSAYFKKR